jgi:hypothetical protein
MLIYLILFRNINSCVSYFLSRTENNAQRNDFHCVFLPVCTVAMAVKAMLFHTKIPNLFYVQSKL